MPSPVPWARAATDARSRAKTVVREGMFFVVEKEVEKREVEKELQIEVN